MEGSGFAQRLSNRSPVLGRDHSGSSAGSLSLSASGDSRSIGFASGRFGGTGSPPVTPAMEPHKEPSREPSLDGYAPLEQMDRAVEHPQDSGEDSDADPIAGGPSRALAPVDMPWNPCLSWVELGPFQSCVALVILLNMVVIAWETDSPDP